MGRRREKGQDCKYSGNEELLFYKKKKKNSELLSLFKKKKGEIARFLLRSKHLKIRARYLKKKASGEKRARHCGVKMILQDTLFLFSLCFRGSKRWRNTWIK